ncbi:hypothetical protein BJ875DRAFT_386096, partial [Amylocarpus encephaloides]
SRPPPIRTHATAASPPPSSPRSHSEKTHHSRRKSGNHNVHEKKTSRPSTVSRRTAPSHPGKVANTWNGGRTSSSRDRDRDDEAVRDSGESFPQFCMSCEKQFQAVDDTFLYCSEPCRLHDQNPTPVHDTSYSHPHTPSSPPLTPYSRHFLSLPPPDEGPDIIPRFSPTQSSPRSYFSPEPGPSSFQAPTYSHSPPRASRDDRRTSSTALASLRELATALPKTSSKRGDPESPPRSDSSSISRTGSGVWDYMPFTSSHKVTTPTPGATPGNSYNGGYTVSQSYGAPVPTGRSREDLYSYGRSHGTYGNTGGMGMDRPLPPRSGPGGYGHRPKSIDLVTPVSGGVN